MKNLNKLFAPIGLRVPEILLPARDIERFAVIACDQHTAEPEYWEETERIVGDAPSALHLMLPEAWLGRENAGADVPANMRRYLADGSLRSIGEGFVYVRRRTSEGIRHGLLAAVDLEQYDFSPTADTLMRATEATVRERLPARIALRREAVLEMPHVLVLTDDRENSVTALLERELGSLPKLYDFDLMQGGGHIAGWAVEDPAMLAQIDAALAALGSQEAFDAKYPQARGAKPLTLAVGDGNHSLAAAKACWEELKAALTPEERESHPARWCLAEVCNVHSPAIEIEPIHRVLFNVDCGAVLLALIAWSDSNMAGICFGDSKQQAFTLAGPHVSNVLSFEDPVAPLTVGTVDEFIEYFMARHSEARVDYVHDEPAVRALTRQVGVAFLLPPFEKSDLFKGIVMGGVLPRKTFSMGHAEEKRYYVECRKITE